MPARKPITIVGGGLAGLTLGIGLRRRGVPVTVWEAGDYPRHRVCGEFISGRGPEVLERFGLMNRCRQAGAVEVRTAMFVLGEDRAPCRELARPGVGLSRHVLDALLADFFCELGGELRRNCRWAGKADGEGVVRASGRRAQTSELSGRWFGVKAHIATGAVALEADLEMHVLPNGYVGLNRIGNGEINVCGLFRAAAESRRAESKADWLRGEPGTLLHERLGRAEFAPRSFCAVAGLELRPRRAGAGDECCIGDALTMTPPVTGNGMSMALESAELAVEPLAGYSEGGPDWAAARRQVAERCDAAFGRRLAWAGRLHWMMVSPRFHGRLGKWLLRSEWLWQFMFRRTRG